MCWGDRTLSVQSMRSAVVRAHCSVCPGGHAAAPAGRLAKQHALVCCAVLCHANGWPTPATAYASMPLGAALPSLSPSSPSYSLPRFAQFFICPLISADGVEREAKAVDSE